MRMVDVNELLRISETAATAFGSLDLPPDGPKAVRLFFQGVG